MLIRSAEVTLLGQKTPHESPFVKAEVHLTLTVEPVLQFPK